MKKAVIRTGSKQYVVTEGETISVELIKLDGSKSATFVPLMVIDGDEISIGEPTLENAKVIADVIEEDMQADKVTAIRYKAKKRVHKTHGHRQHQTTIKISQIKVS
jgi:large subunit ribosomal protein L21